MTKMIAAADFKAACREMLDALDALGDGPLDADALRRRSKALVEAAPGSDGLVDRPGLMPGSIMWLSDDHVGPVDPDWEAEWDANNPPELYR
jgi:hypothetical protein